MAITSDDTAGRPWIAQHTTRRNTMAINSTDAAARVGFDNPTFPMSYTTVARYDATPGAWAALAALEAAGGNAWVWSADRRHKEQFEEQEDYEAYASLDPDQRAALEAAIGE